MFRYLPLLLMLAVAYFAGAKWPMLAQKTGLV